MADQVGARRAVSVATVVATVGLVAAATETTPFTVGADATVAVALAAATVGLVVQRAAWRPRWLARRSPPPSSHPAGRGWTWLVLAMLVGGWEVASYLAAPRADHPTLSSLLDAADRTPVGRGVAFVAWLALGWYLVTW